MITKNDLLEQFRIVGIAIDDIPENVDINLVEEYINDSIEFISLLLQIEYEFNIEIPEEYLTPNLFDSLEKCLQILNSLPQRI